MTTTPAITAPATPAITAPATPAGFTACDYTTVTVPADKVGLYRDCYEAFGRQVERAESGPVPGAATSLSLKRPHALKNRRVIDELQRTCERALKNIERLERSRTTAADAAAYGVGLVGTASMALVVFATIGLPAVPVLPFAVLGFALWAAPVVLRKVLLSRRTSALAPGSRRSTAASTPPASRPRPCSPDGGRTARRRRRRTPRRRARDRSPRPRSGP